MGREITTWGDQLRRFDEAHADAHRQLREHLAAGSDPADAVERALIAFRAWFTAALWEWALVVETLRRAATRGPDAAATGPLLLPDAWIGTAEAETMPAITSGGLIDLAWLQVVRAVRVDGRMFVNRFDVLAHARWCEQWWCTCGTDAACLVHGTIMEEVNDG